MSIVSVCILPKNFIYVDYTNKKLKEKLLAKGCPKYKNIEFTTLEWIPFFNPSKLENFFIEKEILLKNLHLELTNNKTLRKIGNRIGKFVGFVDLKHNYAEKIITIHMNSNDKSISPIEIYCNSSSIVINPTILANELEEDEKIVNEHSMEQNILEETRNKVSEIKTTSIRVNPQ